MKILILNQAFYPDVVSTAQHAADAACELARRGHQVTVIASRRAYDQPEVAFAASENWKGIRILRVWCSSFHKRSKLGRAVNFATFTATAALRASTSGRYDAVVALTSPPLIATVGALLSRITRARLYFWVMDLNPDEAVAAGWLREGALVTRLLRAAQNYNLRVSNIVIALDRFMKQRLCVAGVPERKIRTIAPWSHDESLEYDAEGRERFRAEHGLTGKFVVMYSGNHSPCHPLQTLMEAAERLEDRDDIAFCFIGGGSEFARVRSFARERSLPNIHCLPYQPMEALGASLSSADLHTVVMGDPFAGIVHPCKVYNILRLGIPFLYIGPPESHVTDLAPPETVGTSIYTAGHGEVDRVVTHICDAASRTLGRRDAALTTVAEEFSQRRLTPLLGDIIEGRNTALTKKVERTEECRSVS